MAVLPQKARSVLRVSHGTVPGPAGGGPVTAPARRLEPSRCMFWVWGRSAVSSGGAAAAPYVSTAAAIRTRPRIDRTGRFPDRMGGPPSLGGRPPSPAGTPHTPYRAPNGPPSVRTSGCYGSSDLHANSTDHDFGSPDYRRGRLRQRRPRRAGVGSVAR